MSLENNVLYYKLLPFLKLKLKKETLFSDCSADWTINTSTEVMSEKEGEANCCYENLLLVVNTQ